MSKTVNYGKYINPNNSAFLKEIEDELYVDKSMALNEINEYFDGMFTEYCCSRPPKFGKTYMLDMITAFYSRGCDSRQYFSKMKIASTPNWDKFLNKINVIRVDVKEIYDEVTDKKDLGNEINRRVNEELKEYYPDIDMEMYEDEKTKFPTLFLENCHSVYQSENSVNEDVANNFMILFDNYDYPVRMGCSEDVIDRWYWYLGALFKHNEATYIIGFALATGVLKLHGIYRERCNEFCQYPMGDSLHFKDSFGFTESEVHNLCDKHNLDYERVERLYGGYYGYENVKLFNPYSVIQAIKDKYYDVNWPVAAPLKNTYLKDLILNKEWFDAKPQEWVISLVEGDKLDLDDVFFSKNTIDHFKYSHEMLCYLVDFGYLSYDVTIKQCFIPNLEVLNYWFKCMLSLRECEKFQQYIRENKIKINNIFRNQFDS